MLALDCVNVIFAETLEERSNTSEQILGEIPYGPRRFRIWICTGEGKRCMSSRCRKGDWGWGCLDQDSFAHDKRCGWRLSTSVRLDL